ncbi:flagellar hook-length control protein FliK [Chitinasiproducens palmae]|uniref:Flagellar hook-length control protein FliK n=1 Tax=Chitinasiproducens palmae TaxID=1770053 RepID=A0A1H2PLI7_9BURK|nr:flagellar hook-length control protein FliK [Chitinasiproducens palmae]SDV46941.1 flagellar hook-length control protein FliK [Chitinasiproducens palmae]
MSAAIAGIGGATRPPRSHGTPATARDEREPGSTGARFGDLMDAEDEPERPSESSGDVTASPSVAVALSAAPAPIAPDAAAGDPDGVAQSAVDATARAVDMPEAARLAEPERSSARMSAAAHRAEARFDESAADAAIVRGVGSGDDASATRAPSGARPPWQRATSAPTRATADAAATSTADASETGEDASALRVQPGVARPAEHGTTTASHVPRTVDPAPGAPTAQAAGPRAASTALDDATERAARMLGTRLAYQVGEGVERAELRLDPPLLGTVQVTVRREHGGLAVSVRTASESVAAALQPLSGMIREELTQRQGGQITLSIRAGVSAAATAVAAPNHAGSASAGGGWRSDAGQNDARSPSDRGPEQGEPNGEGTAREGTPQHGDGGQRRAAIRRASAALAAAHDALAIEPVYVGN